ncbi:MAG: cyclic nucleotide-binding domain-containing protein, partial [Anaerolineae bacterium]|nr:cyclic nucleotide-binding domain-containing protein [Anaerolineae bacterium]
MTTDLNAFLSQVPLFAGISGASLRRMAQASRVLRLTKGKLLFQQGDAAEAVFVVLSGGISLVLSQPDGRELVINEMQPSDCFGEMAVITDQARSTGAVAREATEIVVIPRSEFLAVLDAESKLMRRV